MISASGVVATISTISSESDPPSVSMRTFATQAPHNRRIDTPAPHATDDSVGVLKTRVRKPEVGTPCFAEGSVREVLRGSDNQIDGNDLAVRVGWREVGHAYD
jgi:hypothetical protein